MQLNMKATNVDWCHFVTWTPQTTQISTIMRNDTFINELLEAIHEHFWTLTAPPTSISTQLKEIERKAKEQSEKSKMVCEIQSSSSLSSIPHLLQFSPTNIDNQKSHQSKKGSPSKQQKRVLHCSKCRRPLVICNLDKCPEKKSSTARKCLFKDKTQQGTSKLPQLPLMFKSYTNGSNNVTNSCHQDALLVIMSEIMNRNPDFLTPSTNTQESRALKSLQSAWNLNCAGKHHESKMALWLWLQNETYNGRIYYRLGNQSSLEGIIHSLHHYMSHNERNFFTFVTSVSRQCSMYNNHIFTSREQSSASFKIITDEILPEDHTDPLNDKSNISLVKYFKRHAKPSGYSSLSGVCNYKDSDNGNGHAANCDKPATRHSTIKQIPELVVFELFKPDASPLKWDPHVDLEFEVLQYRYKLTGVVYHSQARAHYWSELYVDERNTYGVSPGRYTHDGLANRGNCVKTGNKPNLQAHGRRLSLAFFERQKSVKINESPVTCSKPARTWSQAEASPSGITPLGKKR